MKPAMTIVVDTTGLLVQSFPIQFTTSLVFSPASHNYLSHSGGLLSCLELLCHLQRPRTTWEFTFYLTSTRVAMRPLTFRLIHVFIHNLYSRYYLKRVLVAYNIIHLKININGIDTGGCHWRYYIQKKFLSVICGLFDLNILLSGVSQAAGNGCIELILQ